MRTFRVLRRLATLFRAGCQPGAKRKVTPTPSKAAATFSPGALKLTPRYSRTSAEPTLLEAERLPCLATFAPPAAATKATAVEILKVEAPSPPVPQVSITGVVWGLGSSKRDCCRKTVAIPANSAAETPFACKAAKIAPDKTSGIWPFNHPVINSSAWLRERDF